MRPVARDAAIGVVSGRNAPDLGHVVGRGGISRLKGDCAALAEVAERIIAEGLRENGTAVGAGNAGQVVMGVRATLISAVVERVGDAETCERADGVPGEVSDDGL